ncbi:Uncharacterised protein [uncultured archaeon]|nr:Uncharacterised protein [uncultured archaeon]
MVRKNNSGQMKIQQMIFMIIAVTLLFVLVGLFFLSISLNNLKKTATNLAEENALLLVSKLSNSPEFSCGNSFGTGKTNCIDFDKIMALKGEALKYSNFWGVAKIEIRKIYPNQGSIPCTLENYPDCGVVTILNKNVNSAPASSNFVSLCKKETNTQIIYDKCELAVLLVSSEVKG